MGDFDDLYQGRASNRSWLADRTPEQQDWLNELAAHIREKGREPTLSWRELNRRFNRRWPGEAPADATILAQHVRSLVAQ
jgi:hypothetical protein